MNDILWTILLLSVPGLPLLLAFPALHSRIPWFRYFAILPAAIVVALPVTYTVELSWFLFDAGLGVDGVSRLLLGVSALLWFVASISFSKEVQASEKQPAHKLMPSIFLLAMAANFGAILAIDLVSFFVFSTLLGYAFYGLLVTGANAGLHNDARRAGRIYLVAMIVADLLIFEVLLITAFATGDTAFAAVHQGMAQSDYLTLYLWLVVFSFAIKAGIWPLHFWLVVVLRRVTPALAILLCAVPVTIALLGMLRWLPLGQITSPEMGLMLQGIGVLAVSYAVILMLFGLLKNRQKKLVVIHALVLIGGLFTVAIGTGLADAAVWNQYGNGLYYFIAGFGFFAVILFAITTGLQSTNNHSATTAVQADASTEWFEHWSASIVSWVGDVSDHAIPRWRSQWLAKMHHLLLLFDHLQSVMSVNERSLRVWSLAITLFLLLAVVLIFILMFSGISVTS